MRFLLIMALVIAVSAEARGDWQMGRGEYVFGPDLSEHEACQRAERRAREKAVAAITGERLFSEDLLSCSDRADGDGCWLNRHTWSLIDGEIRGIRNKSVKTSEIGGRTRECVVSLEADVVVGSGRPDPSFDLTVRLNRSVFRSGEFLEISIDPTEAMYLTVFQWLPYAATDQQVLRIFPNQFDRENFARAHMVVPSAGRFEDYDMTVKFPEKTLPDDTSVDEFLMIVGTREPVNFRYAYSIREYRTRLLELPRNEWRQVKKAYTVIKADR